MPDERKAYLWLGLLRTLSPADRRRLLEVFSSPVELLQASETMLDQLVNEKLLKPESREEMLESRNSLLRREEAFRKKNVLFVTPADPDYPGLLMEIPDPPAVLFYRGDLSLLKEHTVLGVVGSRTPGQYGKEMVRHFVPPLAEEGIVIASGLAMGIDTEAHAAAMSCGKTVAVLGGGIDICYPQSNFRIYEEMCREHLVLSEYAPGIPPLPNQFPLRNRIISGISRGVLVVEAREHSGTRITADAALDQGRNVYAIPGRIGDPLSEGTNSLIRMGAMLVRRPEDILEDLGLFLKKRKKGTGRNAALSPDERRILEQLSFVPVYVDDLLPEGKEAEAFGLILSMEKRGLIRQSMQGYYVRLK
ncbi:MAG: DNA-processing protein DprA [Eubacterium sp.]|nr:DNA-processing protein DprA [Eubacterium sp.]